MAYICKAMGWDYWTYMSQPEFFLDFVEDMLIKEAKRKNG
jgi:hypothetical protein